MDEIYRLEKVETEPVDFPIEGVEVNRPLKTGNYRTGRAGASWKNLSGAGEGGKSQTSYLLDAESIILCGVVLCFLKGGRFCSISRPSDSFRAFLTLFH